MSLWSFGYSAYKCLEIQNRPTITLNGGTGGNGGESKKIGGPGGRGAASQISLEDADRFRGALGGNGGKGDERGGEGGVGEGNKFGKRLIPLVNGKVPYLKIVDFCEQYNLEDEIREPLTRHGYVSVKGLLGVTDTTLEKIGFRDGDIAELKSALEEFVAKHGGGEGCMTM
ncbi:hypothetical protein C8F04DRAFT_1113683 [Mycena alexandri]|uniref:SAM domain-containing protein n=1 Tax=Mycena alexandri TaxID=1745969 RepID=A0AAD6WWW3_9AGAR|nr:hypothetical protein C8F04DRAFT_1113683 [Mycena alexandri]